MLSTLDIIIIVIGSLAVVLYATLKIIQLVKYKKEFKNCIKSGMTQLQAKEYCDRFFNKKKSKEQEKDKLYEE